MLKIAVVEDQTEVRESLCQFIRQYAGEQGLLAEVEPFADGAVIAEGYQPGYDIIFLDVEMPRLGGFGAAERIRAVDPDVVLVFVTNMAQYAIKGYEVDALDYVLKPVSYGAFCTKLSRAAGAAPQGWAGGPAAFGRRDAVVGHRRYPVSGDPQPDALLPHRHPGVRGAGEPGRG